ncbi:PAS domain-containing protein [Mucilaginibacter sp. HD30]
MAALPEDFNILAMALESTNSGVVITDYRQADNPIIFCNHAFENLTGYSREEVIGRNCRFLQGNDLMQDELTRLQDAVTNGVAITVELRNYQKNGTMFWNELSIAPVRDFEGALTHFIGIQTDISRKKMMQTDLMEQIDLLNNRLEKQAKYISKIEEILFGIMHASRECLVVLDQDFMIVKANGNFYDIFEETEGDVIGRSFEQIQMGQWNDPGLHTLLIDAYFKNKSFEGFHFHLSKPNDKCREVKVSASKLQVEGIAKDLILVKIRCEFDYNEHKPKLELTSH